LIVPRPELDPVEVAAVGDAVVGRLLIAARRWTKGQAAISRKGNFHQRDVAVASLLRWRDWP
jgi:hypothetical protein